MMFYEKMKLSKTQAEILKRIAEGASHKEIAFERNIALVTVDYHLGIIKRKLNLSNDVQLALFYLKNTTDTAAFDLPLKQTAPSGS